MSNTKISKTKIENKPTDVLRSGNTKIGIFGHTVADYIVREFNKRRNQHKERSPERIRATIVKHGRGHRNIYLDSGRDFSDVNKYYKIDYRNQDLPVDYAPMVALYLRLPNNEPTGKVALAHQHINEIVESIRFLID